MASKKSPVIDTPKLLKDWVEKEMKMSPFKKKNNDQLYRELCRGQLEDVWKFVIDHVKSKENAKHIRGNLKYKQTQTVQEKQRESEVALHQLKIEMAETRAALDLTRRNVQQLQQDFEEKMKLETKLDANVHKKLQDQRVIRTFLLESEQLEDIYRDANIKLKLVSEETKSLVRKHNVSGEHVYFLNDSLCDIDQPIFTLETVSSRNVQDNIQSIHGYLCKIVNGDFGVNAFLLDGLKRKLQQNLRLCRNNHSAQDVLKSVIDSTQENLQRFRMKKFSTTLAISDKPDQSFIPRSGHVHYSNLVSGSSNFQALTDELYQELSDVKRRKTIAELESQLQSLKKSINDSLDRMFENRNCLRLAKEFVNVKLKLVSVEESSQCLSELYSQMETASINSKGVENILTKKDQLIKDCNLILEKKQEIVKLLWQQSNYLLNKLEIQQAENKHFVEDTIRNQVDDIQKCFGILHDSISTEAEAFSKISSVALAVVDVNGQRRLEQSLSTHDWNRFRRGHAKLYRSLEFPYYNAPEKVLSTVIQLKADVEYHTERSKLHERFLDELETPNSDVVPAKITPLVIAKLDETYGEKISLVHKLNDVGDRGRLGLKLCDNIKDSINIWVEQPVNKIDVSAVIKVYQADTSMPTK